EDRRRLAMYSSSIFSREKPTSSPPIRTATPTRVPVILASIIANREGLPNNPSDQMANTRVDSQLTSYPLMVRMTPAISAGMRIVQPTSFQRWGNNSLFSIEFVFINVMLKLHFVKFVLLFVKNTLLTMRQLSPQPPLRLAAHRSSPLPHQTTGGIAGACVHSVPVGHMRIHVTEVTQPLPVNRNFVGPFIPQHLTRMDIS